MITSTITHQSYEANGNMTHDGRRGLDLSWNHLNLPATISNDEDEDATVNYTYLADGTKVLAQAPGTSEGYAYLGTMVYKLNNGSWTLETTPFTGGRFVRNATGTFVEQRHITDHLGSTRAIVEGDDYTEVEQNDYYPFGKRIADNTLPTTPTNRWRFSGKEIQTLGGINLIDYGARLYDEDAVKWKSQDPMAESYLSLTPYGYCAGNPVSFVDQEGKRLFYAEGVSQAFKDAFAATVKYMNTQKTSDNLAKIEKSPVIYTIKETNSDHPVSCFNSEEKTIYWSPDQILETKENLWLSPATILDHEAEHAVRYDTDYARTDDESIKKAYLSDRTKGSSNQYDTKEEERVITRREQRTARRHNETRSDQVTRRDHKGRIIDAGKRKDPKEMEKIISEYNNMF